MKYIVLLNGPPSCGKDTTADFLVANGEHDIPAFAGASLPYSKHEFKSKLISLACEIADITREQWEEMYTRKGKETPNALLNGASPRQFLIHISEYVIKPLMGDLYFGRIAARKLLDGVNVFSDSGFLSEALALMEGVPLENVLVVKIKRPGCTFAGDSRDYLPPGAFPHEVELYNNGDEADFHLDVKSTIKQWLEKLQC